MTLIKWNPISGSSSFRNDIGSLLNSISYELPLMSKGSLEWKPRFEILDIESS